MTAQLQAVAAAREERDAHEAAWIEAMREAYAAGHSLREIAPHAGLSHAGVRHYVRREENAR